MKWKKGILVFTMMVILAVIGTTFLPTLINRSEKELIERTLSIALVKKELPDYAMLTAQKNIVLSTENVDPNSIPQLPGVNLTLMSPGEIQDRANAEGDFLYLRFNKIEIGILKSSVSLDNVWIRSKDTKRVYQSGGGLTLRFYNVLGRWFESPIRQSWIS